MTTPSPFRAHRIERLPLTGAKGSAVRHQFVYMGEEEYVYKGPVTHFDLSTGKSYTYPAVMRRRPIYRHITHNPALTRRTK